jgi:competence protein ComEA
MKLPNWMMLCVLLVATMSQYSINAVAGIPSFSDDFETPIASVELSSLGLADETTIVPLDINIATALELSSLPGIGTKKAIDIVKYRELNGKFVSVEELVNVRGIGRKMLAKLDGYVSV